MIQPHEVAYFGRRAPIPTAVIFAGMRIPVVLQIQSNAACMAIEQEAGAYPYDSPAYRYQEKVSTLARAVLMVRGDVVHFADDPQKDLEARLAWAGEWDEDFTVLLFDEYIECRNRNGYELVKLEHDPNPAAQSAEPNGGDSGPATSSPTATLPPPNPPMSNSISGPMRRRMR